MHGANLSLFLLLSSQMISYMGQAEKLQLNMGVLTEDIRLGIFRGFIKFQSRNLKPLGKRGKMLNDSSFAVERDE